MLYDSTQTKGQNVWYQNIIFIQSKKNVILGMKHTPQAYLEAIKHFTNSKGSVIYPTY